MRSVLKTGATVAMLARMRSTQAFGSTDRITRDVGFYYMSNAAGRLMGTLLSGLSYQAGGLPLCLFTAALMAAFVLMAVTTGAMCFTRR